MQLAIRIRSQSRGSQELPIARDLDPAAGEKSFALPALPAGRYFVDAIAGTAAVVCIGSPIWDRRNG
jgi:hypothetical protein